jgi:hypothetical protein
MTYYDTFNSKIQCDERAQVCESEYDEVMQMMADDHEAHQGYGHWSAEIWKSFV